MPQGCSTLNTYEPRQAIKTSERGAITVLTERAEFVCLEDVESETAQAGEHAWIGSDPRAVFTKCDVAAVVGCCFDRPMRPNCLSRAAGIDRLVGDVEGGFASAVQQSVPGVAGVDKTLDTDNGLGVKLPIAVVEFASRVKDANGAALVAIAASIMAVVRTQRRRGSGEVSNILLQGRLVAFNLND